MLNTFAITGAGRSGTKFLARELARSKQFEVHHEGGGTHILSANDRFQKNCYGEVNSFLLGELMTLEVKNKLVLLRDPYQIFASYVRGGRTKDISAYVLLAISILDSYIKSRVRYVKFLDITNKKESLLAVARLVGINDVAEEDFCLDPENASVNALPRDWKSLITPYARAEFGQFNQRYGL